MLRGNALAATVESAPNATTAALASGKIGRSTVLTRAAEWLTAVNGGPVPYSNTLQHDGYRQDCSGYASMALNLDDPGTTTVGLATSTYTTVISKGDLKAADMLIDSTGGSVDDRHVIIFEKWADSGQSTYWAYEQSGDGGTHHRIKPYPGGEYIPRRYVGFVDGSTTQPALFGAGAVLSAGQYNVIGVKGANHLMYENVWNGAWQGWHGRPGGEVKGTAALVHPPNRLDAFAVGTSGTMYHRVWQPVVGWGNWIAVPGAGTFAGGVAAVYAGKAYHLFAVTPGKFLWQNTWDGAWKGWHSLSDNSTQTFQGTPAVTWNNDTGRMDLFAIGTGGAIFQRSWKGGWNTWSQVPGGGSFAGGLDAVGVGTDLHVFATSPGNRAYHLHWNGAWKGLEGLGAGVTGTPAVTYGSGRFDLFAMSPGGTMQQQSYLAGDWQGWHPIGGAFA
jgi:hypothetical protein